MLNEENGQRRNGRSSVAQKGSFNGLLLLDKPSGITSHDVVAIVRKALSMRAVGHAGTLDPMASGLMVVLLGEATKLSDYLLRGDKGYYLEAQLGVTTDTLDITGEILSESVVDLPRARVLSAVEKINGEIELPIPKFSAKKIDGKKLYEYARNGEDVVVPTKTMKFYDFQELSVEPTTVSLQLKCSKGSFIRAWAAKLGDDLEVGAALKALRRTYSAPYSVDLAKPLDLFVEEVSSLRADGHMPDDSQLAETFPHCFIPVSKALPGILAVTVIGKSERLIRNGQVPHDMQRRFISDQKQANRTGQGQIIKVLSGENGCLIALLELKPCKPVKTKRIFNL